MDRDNDWRDLHRSAIHDVATHMAELLEASLTPFAQSIRGAALQVLLYIRKQSSGTVTQSCDSCHHFFATVMTVEATLTCFHEHATRNKFCGWLTKRSSTPLPGE
jgi:hypothetical protein